MSPDGPDHRSGILVLGVGNELFTDEGLGCVAAARVRALGLPGVDVVDGATAGLALLPELAGRRAVLVLDAILADHARPGDLLELTGDEVPARRLLTVSAHQIGVAEALWSADLAGGRPSTLAAIGLVPADLSVGYGLSPLIRGRMDGLIDRVVQVVDRLAGSAIHAAARAVRTPAPLRPAGGWFPRPSSGRSLGHGAPTDARRTGEQAGEADRGRDASRGCSPDVGPARGNGERMGGHLP